MISRAALDHGISEVLSDLLSSRGGKNDLFKIPVPESMANQSFIEILSKMKRVKNSIVLVSDLHADAQFKIRVKLFLSNNKPWGTA